MDPSGNVQHCGNSKSKQPEYFPIFLYGTAVYAGLYELVRRYRTADDMLAQSCN